MRASIKRLKKRREERKERKVFALILLITACPIVVMTFLISWSSRPDLYYMTSEQVEGGAKAVDWRTLDSLVRAPGGPTVARPDLFGPEVQVVGYMVRFEQSREENGLVARFLLVPDPGSWLHPPHVDPGEAIDVRLEAGRTTPLLDRKAVIVRGSLSVYRMKLMRGEIVYHLTATAVQAFNK